MFKYKEKECGKLLEHWKSIFYIYLSFALSI